MENCNTTADDTKPTLTDAIRAEVRAALDAMREGNVERACDTLGVIASLADSIDAENAKAAASPSLLGVGARELGIDEDINSLYRSVCKLHRLVAIGGDEWRRAERAFEQAKTAYASAMMMLLINDEDGEIADEIALSSTDA